MKDFIYPLAPPKVDKNVLKPSNEYQFESYKVALSILLFIIVYCILIMLSIGLAGIVSFLGIQLIILKPMFVTIMIGAGMIGLGLMVIYFLIKFIFSTKKVDRSGLYEIQKSSYPELYSFIKTLAQESGAPMPKRIYLSPEVNASVFYDSSILSMFFPVKKNLLIGLGFVNSVNMSEFKAVIAHEFGHFSQHSMRLGSYVFNVNRIIYNMLYDNKGYTNAIDRWAEASGYFTIFAKLTIKIVEAIQWILQKVYIVVNKSNLSLSRQMEHHADTVSAYVCGSQYIITALKRMEVSVTCYNILLNYYEKWIANNLKPDNIFAQHSEVLSHISKEYNFELENGLPRFDIENQMNILQSRIVVKDQWSSHPSTIEREQYLKLLNIEEVTIVKDTPWVLFGDSIQIQKTITEKLFAGVRYQGTAKTLDFTSFKEKYYHEFNSNTYNKEYKGFYNDRRIKSFDINELKGNPNLNYSFEELFSNESCSLPRELGILDSDLQILMSMNSNQIQIKAFEFEGKKCDINDVPILIKQLEQEKSVLQSQIDNLDEEITKIALLKSNESTRVTLIDLFSNYFKVAKESELSVSKYTELSNVISPIYSRKIPFEVAKQIISEVKIIEQQIEQQIKGVLSEAKEQQLLDNKQFEKLARYLSKDREYFGTHGFNNTELDILNEGMNVFISLMYEREFRIKKKLLTMQLEILNNN